jgi:hypothetical protein
MIEGLKLNIPSKELAELVKSRAGYHRSRADLKEKEQLPMLRATLPDLEKAMAVVQSHGQNPQKLGDMGKFSSNSSYNMNENPVDQLKKDIEKLELDIRSHRNKALVFDFISTHLFDDTYSLTETDLTRLEILK